jgi:catechol 2,3-dioxygenase
LILKHDPNAKEPPHNFAGLFHFAVLVPDRKSLAHAFLALQKNKVQFDGFADHLVSESLYLHDPERNGIEIYRDKPISEWTYDSDGHVIMDTLPLDLAGILGELPQEDRRAEDPPDGAFPNGARIGHMHLRVTNLEKSVKFYTEIFGFHVSADWSSFGAMFLSAGKYHHHLGLNTWHSLGGKQHIDGEAGLDEFTIQLPRENGSSSSHYVQSLESQLRERSLTAEKIEDGRRELLVADPDAIPVRICCPTQQS